jgi:hypothetical protein
MQYMFNFIGGGWNTIDAPTKREAIKLAKKEYSQPKYNGYCRVNAKTFRKWTQTDYDNHMRLFW